MSTHCLICITLHTNIVLGRLDCPARRYTFQQALRIPQIVCERAFLGGENVCQVNLQVCIATHMHACVLCMHIYFLVSPRNCLRELDLPKKVCENSF